MRTSLLPLAISLPLAAFVRAATPQYGLAGLDEVTVATVRTNLLKSANLSWELGTAVQALLELDYVSLSVYNQSAYPPPEKMNETDPRYPKDAFALIDRVVSQKPEDIDPLIEDGAVGDPASLGVGVILRNWTRTDTNNSIYSFYAGQQAGYLIHKAPRTKDDAVSHRNDQVQLWSDFVSMGPPFLAYFGATFGGPDGLWLMQYAFNQCRLYRQYLKDAQSGLWKHIVLGNWQDNAHWATGNAWAAAGMLRTLVAIQHSPGADQMKAEQRNLTTWIGEILGSTWPGQQLNGTLLNVLDAQPQNTFADSAATALLTAVTFRHALISNDTSYIDKAVLAMQLVKGSIDEFGWLRFTVDPYTFDKPLQRTGNEWGSPEGQAFVLMMHAAWRDYLFAGGAYRTPGGGQASSTATTTEAAQSYAAPLPTGSSALSIQDFDGIRLWMTVIMSVMLIYIA